MSQGHAQLLSTSFEEAIAEESQFTRSHTGTGGAPVKFNYTRERKRRALLLLTRRRVPVRAP